MNSKALALLRYSWVVLFLWFGFQQLTDAASWVGFLPEWVGYMPIPAEMIVQVNGWLEITAALAMLTGSYLKIVAGFLSLHLMFIAISVGGAVGMRDAVLAMIGVSLVMTEPDKWTLDYKAKNKTM